MREARIEPSLCRNRERLRLLASHNPVVPVLKLASAGAFCVFRNCLALALRGFSDHLSSESKLVPPHIPSLIDTHLVPPLFGGRPPFFPFSLAISRIRSIPNFSTRAL